VRVFMGPTEVAGYYAALRRGFVELGVSCILVDDAGSAHRYETDDSSAAVRLLRAAKARTDRAAARGGRSVVVASKLESLTRVLVFLYFAVRCDAFIYSYGGSLTFYPSLELRFLRWMGKRTVFVYHGNDSRLPYLGHPRLTTARGGTLAECMEYTARLREGLRLVERYADVIVANPFSAHLHLRRAVNWQIIGIPFPAPHESEAEPAARGDGRVRVLHSPSDPEMKGTDRVRQAVASLIERGRPIDYIEITGRPHAEVIAELRRCDIVVDQVYSDTPMAGFATEAAAYGRPAVIGSYIGPHLERFVPPASMPPVALCHPEVLEQTLDALVTDRDAREELGRRAREWVIRERAPRVVAARYLRLFRDDVPAVWTFDPQDVHYVNGLASEEFVRRWVRALVAHGGADALHLDENPGARDRLLAFAGFDADGGDRSSAQHRPAGAAEVLP
jgi:hypothetical protein